MKALLPRSSRPSVASSEGYRTGFTLIEVLVVVAIIALLISILLPSLSRAREQARTAVCASQLKEVGNALTMYMGDSRDCLPGPVHAAMELETYQKNATADYEQWHLPWYLRKYVADRSKAGKGMDRIGTCPTADRLIRAALEKNWANSTFDRPFTYSLNNWKKGANGGVYGTDPPWYFGYPDNFWENAPAPFKPIAAPNAHTKDAAPKKVSSIPQLGREWAIGDAFLRDVALPLPKTKKDGQWRTGTYQLANVANNIGMPKEPYHSGGINVLCLDSHVEWQRPWKASVNNKQ